MFNTRRFKQIGIAILVTAILYFLVAPGSAFAGCVCTCINGRTQALCSSVIDLRPICSPRICPITPPSIKPIPRIGLPPLGTKICTMKQVLNPYTRRYEWRRVCW